MQRPWGRSLPGGFYGSQGGHSTEQEMEGELEEGDGWAEVIRAYGLSEGCGLPSEWGERVLKDFEQR